MAIAPMASLFAGAQSSDNTKVLETVQLRRNLRTPHAAVI